MTGGKSRGTTAEGSNSSPYSYYGFLLVMSWITDLRSLLLPTERDGTGGEETERPGKPGVRVAATCEKCNQY